MAAATAATIDELTAPVFALSAAIYGQDDGSLPPPLGDIASAKLKYKLSKEYSDVKDMPLPASARPAAAAAPASESSGFAAYVEALPESQAAAAAGEAADIADLNQSRASELEQFRNKRVMAAVQMRNDALSTHVSMRPAWRAPWKLYRVLTGHTGWVRSLAVDPTNRWFATGAADRTIKVWDLATGDLWVTLTGHISAVRGLAVSARHPYLFSCGEDKMVKCWDLEQNKVIRQYHGHRSGVYAMALHPELDLLITGGRDTVARVWDMRTKAEVMCLQGHGHTVCALGAQAAEPQVITSSVDCTIRLWDLKKGTTRATLTHHKKSVRALALSKVEYTFVSASADNTKKWLCPDGAFLQNFVGSKTIVNALALNDEGVLVSGGDDGAMRFYDYKTGYNFQSEATIAQSGSLESEAGVFCMGFDMTGSRLITGEADKTIKLWREDETATPESHPVDANWTMDASRF